MTAKHIPIAIAIPITPLAVTPAQMHLPHVQVLKQVREKGQCVPPPCKEEQEPAADVDVQCLQVCVRPTTSRVQVHMCAWSCAGALAHTVSHACAWPWAVEMERWTMSKQGPSTPGPCKSIKSGAEWWPQSTMNIDQQRTAVSGEHWSMEVRRRKKSIQ